MRERERERVAVAGRGSTVGSVYESAVTAATHLDEYAERGVGVPALGRRVPARRSHLDLDLAAVQLLPVELGGGRRGLGRGRELDVRKAARSAGLAVGADPHRDNLSDLFKRGPAGWARRVERGWVERKEEARRTREREREDGWRGRERTITHLRLDSSVPHDMLPTNTVLLAPSSAAAAGSVFAFLAAGVCIWVVVFEYQKGRSEW